MVRTQKTFGRSDGRKSLACFETRLRKPGVIFLSTAVLEFALEVGFRSQRFDFDHANKASPVDFALTEAAYTIVRMIQRFPVIKLPPNEPVVKTGKEKQIITLVISIKDGCNVVLE